MCHYFGWFVFENNDGEQKAPSKEQLHLVGCKDTKEIGQMQVKSEKKISTCTKNFNGEGSLGELALFEIVRPGRFIPPKLRSRLHQATRLTSQ